MLVQCLFRLLQPIYLHLSLLQLSGQVFLQRVVVALLQSKGQVHKGLVLVLFHQTEDTFVSDTQCQGTDKPSLRHMLLFGLSVGCHAGFEVMDDVAGELLEVEEELLLLFEHVEV